MGLVQKFCKYFFCEWPKGIFKNFRHDVEIDFFDLENWWYLLGPIRTPQKLSAAIQGTLAIHIYAWVRFQLLFQLMPAAFWRPPHNTWSSWVVSNAALLKQLNWFLGVRSGTSNRFKLIGILSTSKAIFVDLNHRHLRLNYGTQDPPRLDTLNSSSWCSPSLAQTNNWKYIATKVDSNLLAKISDEGSIFLI